jgi:Gpi18-like mannosyltransferase
VVSDDLRAALTPRGLSTMVTDHVVTQSGSSFSDSISLSYAFFPFYPLMIRIFAYPLSIFGMNEIATATLAGVVVSALGTLLGMLALFDLTRDSLGEEGALRTSFYLIIFPTSFFLIQVYTEGLFVG